MMKVKCPNCHKVFDFDDKRLPKGEKFSFPCKDCKTTIEVDLKSGLNKDGATRSQTNQKDQQKTKDSSGKKELGGEALKKKILRTIHDLPPMPQTVFKARKIIQNPKSSFEELAGVLETDQAIATKVLKLANSSYYGLSGTISSIKHASVILGHKALGDLITMAGTSGLLGSTLNGYGLEAGDLWLHSMGVAFGSRIIAEKKKPELINDAFAAGLIHDAGKLVLDKYIFERKEEFEEFMKDGKQSFLAAEKEILGFDHAEIAFDLCENWRVPETLTISIKYHHYPSMSERNELTYIVHMADVIAIMTAMGGGIDGMFYKMDDEAMEFLGFEEEDVDEVTHDILEAVEKISEQMHAD